MDTIAGMRMFVAVAAQKSFTAGARQRGASTKLASKYVRQLEQRLGAQLFNRTTRSVTLTDIGHAYLQRCIPILDQIDEMEGVVQERQSRLAGVIRITAPTGFGSRELVEALRPFQDEHPQVEIELRLSDQHVSIVDEGFDLAIRFGALSDSTLAARRLARMRIVVVAAPAYLETRGEPTDPSALATHNCLIQLTSPDRDHWRFMIDGAEEVVRVGGSFRANSPRAVVHMAVGGLGVARCPYYAAKPFIASGALNVLFEMHEPAASSLYAVYPPNRHVTARIRALIDHLRAAFGPSRA